MVFVLSQKSRDRLNGVHPDLKRVVERAIETTPIDFTVIEGLRTVDQEAINVAHGASQTMHSRHLPNKDGFACAVDVGAWINGTVSWQWSYYDTLAKVFKQAATELGIPIEWGGDWESLKDGGHFQLPWASYP